MALADRPALSRRVAEVSFVVLVGVLLFGLRELAADIVAGQLQRTADRQLARVEANQPLWQWTLTTPRDLVAGRAFGAADVRRADHGLRIDSRDGTPFELGLPVRRPLDAGNWPLLDLRVDSASPFRLGVIWAPQLDMGVCSAWLAQPVPAAQHDVRVDLRSLPWRHADGSACAAPQRIEILRLQLQLPAHASLQLTSLALRRAQVPELPTRPTLRLPGNAVAADRMLAATTLPAMPWIALPADASAETQLELRQQVWQRAPAALVLRAGDLPQPRIAAAVPAWLAWAGTIAYLLALLALAHWPPAQPLRRWLELGACLAGPLWLVIGLQLGLHLAPASVAVFAGALLFAAHAEWRQRPVDWRWCGRPRDWLLPFALVPVALVLITLFGRRFQLPLAGHVLAYLAWATLQQWLMLSVVLHRLERTRLHSAGAVLVTAVVFALMHTPNGALMQLCLLAELWWAWCFVRSRALLPIALAHALAALLVEAGLVGGVLRSLEVSARFFL